jgi:hypothetical protein
MLFIKMPTVTVAVRRGTGTCANTFSEKISSGAHFSFENYRCERKIVEWVQRPRTSRCNFTRPF